jgi:hypothetical protein
LTRHLSKEFWKGIGERVDGRGEEKKGIGEGSIPPVVEVSGTTT